MKNISIHNMRTNETSSENRLIKFFKSNSNSKVELSTNPQSVVLLEDGFEICLAPVIIPDICENAKQTVGIYINNIPNKLSWRIINITTDQVLVEGDVDENYQNDVIYNIVDKINNSNLNIKARYIYDDGSPFAITNISEEPIKIRFELNNSSEDFFDVSQYFNEWSGINENESYTQVTPFSFEVCLSKNTPPEACENLEYNKPLRLYNSYFEYPTEGPVRLSYIVTNLSNGNTYSDYIESHTEGMKLRSRYYIPNSGNVNIPNNIGITHASPSLIFDDFRSYFRNFETNLINGRSINLCKVGKVTKEAFIGFNETYFYNYPETIVADLGIYLNNVEHRLGKYEIQKTTYSDVMSKLYAFYKPKLEEFGFTVTSENRGDGIFFPRQSLHLVYEANHTDDLYIKLSRYSDTNLNWDSGITDWEVDYGYFWDTACSSGEYIEEENPNDSYLEFIPIESNQGDFSLYEEGPFRIQFVTINDIEYEASEDTYDWVALNYPNKEDRDKLIFETCYQKVRQAE